MRREMMRRGFSSQINNLIAAFPSILLAVCGIASLLSILTAEPLNAQFFLGIVGVSCIPAALLRFIKPESPERMPFIIFLEFLIMAYPIVVSFAPHFNLDFNPIAVIIVICAGIPAIYLSRSPHASRITVFNVLWAIFGFSLFLRAFLPYHGVFKDVPRFGADDPVFHMRLIENALFGDHFPFRIFYDAYTHFPFGNYIHFAPLYDQIIIFATWIIGLGKPTYSLMNAIAAYYPAILGACVVFPVYFIGKTLHNEFTGIIAAALVGVLPGQFLNRSIIGYTDHHVGEVLFSTIAMLFLILALKHASDSQERSDADVEGGMRSVLLANFDIRKDWAVIVFAAGATLPLIVLPWAWGLLFSFSFFCMIPLFGMFVREDAKPLFFALAAGISLGVYLLIWVAGLMFAFIIFLYGIIQYVIDFVRKKDISYLCEVLSIEFIIPLIMLITFFNISAFYDIRHAATFGLGFIVFASPLIYRWITIRRSIAALERARGSRIGSSARMRWSSGGVSSVMMPFLPFITMLLIAMIASIAAPSAISSVLGAFRALTPAGGALTIAEVSPLFRRHWAWWTAEPITLFISYPALIMLGWLVFERRRPEHLLVLVWSVFILTIIGAIITDIGQNRFAYYFTVNASLLTAFFATKTYDIVGGVEEDAQQEEFKKERLKRVRAEKGARAAARRKGGSRRKEAAPEFDFLPITLGVCVVALLIAGIKYVGISSMLPWLAAFLIPFVVWIRMRSRNRGDENERNMRRAIIAMLLIAFILFPFPLNALVTRPESAVVPANGTPAMLRYTLEMTSERMYGAHDDWYEVLRWMRNNTPDPGVDYYTTYIQHLNRTTGRYEYPESAYGVMSWWDYGHIITYIGHRIPNANPFQAGIGGPPVVKYYDANGDGNYTGGEPVIADRDRDEKFSEGDEVLFGSEPRTNAKLRRFSIDEMYHDANDNYKYDKGEAIVRDNDGNSRFTDGDDVLMGETPPDDGVLRILSFIPGASTFLLAQDERIASKILDELGTRYVISEYRMIDFTCGVYPVWTGEPVWDYCRNVLTPEGKVETLRMPKFWRSMEMRLHIFDGCGTALSYGNETLYIEPLRHYRLVHESPTTFGTFGEKELKFVKIFEYVRGARIIGSAPNGSIVEISTNVTTNQNRTFTYVQRTLSNGSFSFVFPYSTACPSPISVADGGTNYDVCASPSKLRIGNVNTSGEITWISEREVHVPEYAVLNGGTVEV